MPRIVNSTGPSQSLCTPSPVTSHFSRQAPSPLRVYIGCANIGALRPRIDRLIMEFSRVEYSLFCIQETHLYPKIPSIDVAIPGYSFIRLDRVVNGNNGGGLGIYIRKSVTYRAFAPPESPLLEAFGCSVHFAGISYAILTVYRPRQTAALLQEWIHLLVTYVSKCIVPGYSVILCGDFNLHRPAREAAILLASLEALNLFPQPLGPTHDRREIDYFACSSNIPELRVSLADPLEPSTLGHKVICASFLTSPPRRPAPPPPSATILWSKADFPRMSYMLQYHYGTDQRRNIVNELRKSLDGPIDTAWSSILDLLLTVFYACVPVRCFPPRKHPWLTPDVRALIRDTHSAFMKSAISPIHCAEYRSLRNKRNKSVIRAKASYARHLLEHVRTPRAFWCAIRALRGHSNAPAIPTLFDENATFSTDIEKASAISDSLVNNYHVTVDMPVPFPDSPTPSESFPTLEFVEYQLGNLKPHTSSGIDGLHPRYLHVCRFAIAPIVCEFLAKVLSQQCIPSQWRLGRVTPIPKADLPTTSPDSYRPITILPVISKIYESHLLELLGPYLEPHIYQFGFSPRCGTEDASLRLQERIAFYRTLSTSPVPVVIISLDLRKAFDTVQYCQILAVLSRRGCPKWLVNLVLDFLSQRQHVVRVGAALSQPSPVPSGVPQGSRIAPHLFNVAVDDLLRLPLSRYTSISLYADDCILSKPILSDSDRTDLQLDVDRVVAYIKSIHMDINSSKSNVFVVKGSRRASTTVDIYVSGHRLGNSETLRHLGFHYDSDLTFDHHWTLSCSKARSQLGSLNATIKRFSVPGLLPTVYKQCILPGLLYGLPTCTPGRHSIWAQLEGVHRLAACLTLRIHSRRVRNTALYNLLGWSSIRTLATKRALMFMLRCTIFNRRFGMFLSCMISPPRLSCLRSRPFTEGQYLLYQATNPNPTLPLNRIITLWNKCIAWRPCEAPKDIVAYISSQSGHNII